MCVRRETCGVCVCVETCGICVCIERHVGYVCA